MIVKTMAKIKEFENLKTRHRGSRRHNCQGEDCLLAFEDSIGTFDGKMGKPKNGLDILTSWLELCWNNEYARKLLRGSANLFMEQSTNRERAEADSEAEAS